MKIFISHITEESALALVLKDWIESTFVDQCEVFVSSDLRDIPAGSKWLEEIDQALEGSVVMLLLCSPASISRPWVNFEAGCGWIKRIPIIPICHSGQRENSLPVPISVFQALELESDNFVPDLFNSFAQHLKIVKVPRIDQTEMRRELDGAVRSIIPSSRNSSMSEAGAGEVDDTRVKILEAIAKLGDDGYSAEELVPHLDMTGPKMEYYLDILVDSKLLNRHLYMGDPSRYTLTKAGRKFLVERGLL
ncbi:MAG TPA: TIR domain-containing protein [Desulfobacterales bacterium]|nr:TIR domain-containing protein [Desulfobacterales bacterium]